MQETLLMPTWHSFQEESVYKSFIWTYHLYFQYSIHVTLDRCNTTMSPFVVAMSIPPLVHPDHSSPFYALKTSSVSVSTVFTTFQPFVHVSALVGFCGLDHGPLTTQMLKYTGYLIGINWLRKGRREGGKKKKRKRGMPVIQSNHYLSIFMVIYF